MPSTFDAWGVFLASVRVRRVNESAHPQMPLLAAGAINKEDGDTNMSLP